jgi:uroporphyrinogen decarboxylase
MVREASVRDRFLRAIRRQEGGYVPKNISLCPPQRARFESVYGHSDVAGEWRLPVRHAGLPFRAVTDDFSGWHGELNGNMRIDEWGIGHEPARDGSHFERLIHPLSSAQGVDEIRDFPFPRPAGADDVARLAARVSEIRRDGFVSAVSVAPVGGTVFWPAYKLRGMENVLCDMLDEPEIAGALLEKVTEICEVQARLVASAGPDMLHLADDLGTQNSTYMSPATFREWIKPRLARVISAARSARPGILVHFHSDGAVQNFIPDLIEIGVDILNPIQPECMDPVEIKRKYGDALSFSGCVGTQTTMPFGSSDEVRDKVKLYCQEVGQGGGLWIAPTHLVEPEVPWENIIAFVEAADVFGCG